LAVGGSANGDRLLSFGSIGEYTVVASAKRGVRGTLMDAVEPEELDEVRSRVRCSGRVFSLGATALIRFLTGHLVRHLYSLDMFETGKIIYSWNKRD
jgi:hypothetical protein